MKFDKSFSLVPFKKLKFIDKSHYKLIIVVQFILNECILPQT